jgi:hypothetical protein
MAAVKFGIHSLAFSVKIAKALNSGLRATRFSLTAIGRAGYASLSVCHYDWNDSQTFEMALGGYHHPHDSFISLFLFTQPAHERRQRKRRG